MERHLHSDTRPKFRWRSSDGYRWKYFANHFALIHFNSVAPTLIIAGASHLTNQTTQTIAGTIDGPDAGLTVSIYDGLTLLGTGRLRRMGRGRRA